MYSYSGFTQLTIAVPGLNDICIVIIVTSGLYHCTPVVSVSNAIIFGRFISISDISSLHSYFSSSFVIESLIPNVSCQSVENFLLSFKTISILT